MRTPRRHFGAATDSRSAQANESICPARPHGPSLFLPAGDRSGSQGRTSPQVYMRGIQERLGMKIAECPRRMLDADTTVTHKRLIAREQARLEDALEGGDMLEIAHALAGLTLSAYLAAFCFGIDLDATLAATQRADMGVLESGAQSAREESDSALAGSLGALPRLAQVLGLGEGEPCLATATVCGA